LFKQFSYYQHIYSCIIININTGGVFKIENLEQFLQHYGYIAVFIGNISPYSWYIYKGWTP